MVTAKQATTMFLHCFEPTAFLHKPQTHLREEMERPIMKSATHTMYSAQVLLYYPSRLSA